MSNLAIIVPARLASLRLPRKLLLPVQGLPLILWTAQRIRNAAPDIPLYFAVDSDEMAQPLKEAGYDVVLTDPACASGTDRIAEANLTIGADFVINVQADEPLVTKGQIDKLKALILEGPDMATLATPLADDNERHNPNVVKVVTDRSGKALYFSRAPIPWLRDPGKDGQSVIQSFPFLPLRHLGMYAYRGEFLQAFKNLPPSPLEQTEKLEQLRALEHGYSIAVGITEEATIGVDTLEDLEAFRNTLK